MKKRYEFPILFSAMLVFAMSGCGEETEGDMRLMGAIEDGECVDNPSYASNCPGWAKAGYCTHSYVGFMKANCCASCNGGSNDACPSDPNKTDPGVCGCGVPDTDRDKDGTEDCNDSCPYDTGKTEHGI